MELSAVVLTKNEEVLLDECLTSLSFCDEVIVVDDLSTDSTLKIAEAHSAKIYTRDLAGDFSSQRNFGLEKARGRWVLFVDADERISPLLAEEIEKAIQFDAYVGYFIKRTTLVWGKKLKHGVYADDRVLRLGLRTAGRWQRKVHESWVVKGKTQNLANLLYHYPHEDLASFINAVNFYSDLHAQANYYEGKRSNLAKIIIFPMVKLIKNVVINKGYKDGSEGLVVAFLMSFHSFLAWSKLWLFQKKHS